MKPQLNFKTLCEIFRDISTVVHTSMNVDEVLELVVWRFTKIFGAKGTALRILNLKKNELEQFDSYGLGDKYLSKGPLSNNKTIEELCRLGKIITIEDILMNPRIQNPQEIWEEGIRLVLDLPLIIGEDILGIIRIYFSEKGEFSHEEYDFFGAVSEQCACAIDKARMFEEQQSQYDQLALQTEKLSALGRMAAGIAHEINNPLAGILLFSTNMRKKAPKEGPLKEGLAVIIRETQRCKGIIQDLLEFSRDKEPTMVLAGINDIFEKALRILENEFRIHHISVKINLSSDIPDILLDVNLMQQVFVNLLINAREAIQDNGVITVQSHMSPDHKSVKIEIVDTGCGIPSDNIANIFDPFFSTKKNGTGLGLAVSYGIVQKHQGNIHAYSQPGDGASFTIEIPVGR